MNKYKRYIELGFVRTDLNDKVEFNDTGYYGYALQKNINDKLFISVYWSELDTPKLYVKKSVGTESYHIKPLTWCEMVDLLNSFKAPNKTENDLPFPQSITQAC